MDEVLDDHRHAALPRLGLASRDNVRSRLEREEQLRHPAASRTSHRNRRRIGDRAGPRYQLKTFRLTLRAAEPCAKIDSRIAAVRA